MGAAWWKSIHMSHAASTNRLSYSWAAGASLGKRLQLLSFWEYGKERRTVWTSSDGSPRSTSGSSSVTYAYIRQFRFQGSYVNG